MNAKTCLLLFHLLSVINGALDVAKPRLNQVTTFTWNTDAYFTKIDVSKQPGQTAIGNLASVVGQSLAGLSPQTPPEFIVLHLQEVTSCASKANGIKMACSTTFEEIDVLSQEKSSCSTPLCWALKLFGLKLGNSLTAAFKLKKEQYICSRVVYFQAIGTVFCHRSDVPGFDMTPIAQLHIGESPRAERIGIKFGFKGGLVLRVRFQSQALPLIPDIFFVNVHLSSKVILDRREHLLLVLKETFIEELKEQNHQVGTRNAIFFFAGDFNARSGSNYEGVADNAWARDVNLLAEPLRTCSLHLTDLIYSTGDLGEAFKLLNRDNQGSKDIWIESEKLPAKIYCADVFGVLRDLDEFSDWFDRQKDILNEWWLHVARTALGPQKPIPRVRFSPMQVPYPYYLPSYCLQRKKVKKFTRKVVPRAWGHYHKGGIVHYTDRLFVATRQALSQELSDEFNLIANQDEFDEKQNGQAKKSNVADIIKREAVSFWEIKQTAVSGNVLLDPSVQPDAANPLSDHAAVFGTFALRSITSPPDWAQKRTPLRKINGQGNQERDLTPEEMLTALTAVRRIEKAEEVVKMLETYAQHGKTFGDTRKPEKMPLWVQDRVKQESDWLENSLSRMQSFAVNESEDEDDSSGEEEEIQQDPSGLEKKGSTEKDDPKTKKKILRSLAEAIETI